MGVGSGWETHWGLLPSPQTSAHSASAEEDPRALCCNVSFPASDQKGHFREEKKEGLDAGGLIGTNLRESPQMCTLESVPLLCRHRWSAFWNLGLLMTRSRSAPARASDPAAGLSVPSSHKASAQPGGPRAAKPVGGKERILSSVGLAVEVPQVPDKKRTVTEMNPYPSDASEGLQHQDVPWTALKMNCLHRVSCHWEG